MFPHINLCCNIILATIKGTEIFTKLVALIFNKLSVAVSAMKMELLLQIFKIEVFYY